MLYANPHPNHAAKNISDKRKESSYKLHRQPFTLKGTKDI